MSAGGRYTVVRADLAVHGSTVLELCEANIADFGAERYRKYYERNPLGRPLAVLAREEATGHFVGTAAFHPAELTVSGRRVKGAVASDFAIDPGHRGFGPASALQRALVEWLDERGWSFVVGLPNPPAAAVQRRIGYAQLGPLTRLARPTTVRDALQAFREQPSRERLRAVVRRPRAAGSGLEVERPRRFDERFEDLWLDARTRFAVSARRSLEVANWRYDFDRDGSRYELVAVTDGSAVVAYAVTYETESVWHVAELLWRDDAGVDRLTAALLDEARAAGAAGVDVLLLEGAHGLAAQLQGHAFFGVPEHTYITVLTKNPELARSLLDRERWLFFEGVVDV